LAITYSNNNDSLVSLDKLSIFKSIIENEIDRKAGQGGSAEPALTEIPPATYSDLGGVIPDGETITINSNGVITSRAAVVANELTYAETMAILNASS